MIYCSPLGSPLMFYVLLTSPFLHGNLFYFRLYRWCSSLLKQRFNWNFNSGMILLPWLIYTKQWKKIPSLLNPLAILLFLLIVSPWLYLVQSKYPQFYTIFIDQQFNRFSSKEFNNKQPWCFYLMILFVSFLPWLFASRFTSIKTILKIINHALYLPYLYGGLFLLRFSSLFLLLS